MVAIGCMLAASAGVLMAEGNAPQAAAPATNAVQQQKDEGKDAKNELKEKKIEAMKAQLAKQHADNVAFLKEKLAKSKLTDVQQEEIISFVEKQYGERLALRDERAKDLVAYIETLAADETQTMEQKKAALKEYVAKKKAEAKALRDKQKAEKKAEMEKIKAEKKEATAQ
jgi:hypothetical protein